MKKIILALLLLVCFSIPSFATVEVDSAYTGVSITDTLTVHSKCRAVWVGTSQSLDFSFDGSTWVTFQGSTGGTLIPIQVVGVRITSGAGTPAAGDVVFLY